MTTRKRYQVFISSTFTDLVDERTEVTQAIWEMNQIPVGMEMFPATGRTQWEHIKSVIDESDYYVLVIGARYGTLTPEGISWTEREFDYAKALGMNPLVFVHASPGDIPSKYTDPEHAAKLEAFRTKAIQDCVKKDFSSPHQLAQHVTASLNHEMHVSPRKGWVRADAITAVGVSMPFNSRATPEEIALGREVRVSGTRTLEAGEKEDWTADVTWRDIWRMIAPQLLDNPDEHWVESRITYLLVTRSLDGHKGGHVQLRFDVFPYIKLQLRSLKFVDIVTVSANRTEWRITERGEAAFIS